MNKKIFFIGLLTVIAIIAFAIAPKINDNNNVIKADEGIRFIESNWAKAKAEAKKQGKLIFLDAYTTWCGPCRMLKRNTFPDKAAGEFFNKNFVNVALDMESGDGPAVAATYGVNAYPTLIITDADGKLITYTKGYIDAKQLIEFGKYGLSKK
ncbi:MAG: thioredoxin family protein [Ferruginibacter sp.]|nr:thioredoxin family protein [Bacteroidota bacterium]MBX2918359.1 thioredoxin family protein [Ferruginibacter sp.]MCB0710393.1 thioredoxin family protein [Chitinophagaceae bacterium]MCC7378063.1 thioredoxin family protein [Chitinophagaceae bacterium]